MKKQFSKSEPTCKVTFSVSKELAGNAKKIVIVGEFNDWDHTGIPLKKGKVGFSTSIDLPTGSNYQYKFLADDANWFNDADADFYVPSPYYGIENSVVDVPIKDDDLKKIEGIGPKIDKVLKERGINTYNKLSSAPIADIKAILETQGKRYAIHDPSTWPDQAKLAAEGKWDDLRKWQNELLGGK